LQSAYLRSYPDAAGNEQTFLVTAPQNEADGSVTGLELAGSAYLNNVPALAAFLPEWSKGFGISANYTYIDSKQKLKRPFELKYCPSRDAFNNSSLSLFGCDTNGLPFTDLPLQYLSKNAYNLMFFYDNGPLSMRLAYSWRGRFLQGVNRNGTAGGDATSADPSRIVDRPIVDANGQPILDAIGVPMRGPVPARDVSWGLPVWQEASGQLDFGLDYRFTERLNASFNISNLTDVTVKQTQQQHIGTMPRSWFEPGRNYRLALRYSY
jgi:outer membrane receptor protein involved in Fe transport